MALLGTHKARRPALEGALSTDDCTRYGQGNDRLLGTECRLGTAQCQTRQGAKQWNPCDALPP